MTAPQGAVSPPPTHTSVALYDCLDSLRSRGYLRGWRTSEDPNRDVNVLEVEILSGEWRSYAISATEFMNDGFEFWLRTVERDIVSRSERYYNQQTGIHNAPFGLQFLGQSSVLDQQIFSQQQVQNLRLQQQALSQQQFSGQQQFIGGWDLARAPDPKAAARSAELFLMACGKAAFDTLEAGKPLAITGSKGTKYMLHKRASYCVERASDNARLCAVVPGVPLYDHLLGIKLMIENDEPKFLETANVAQNNPYWNNPSWNEGWRDQLAENVMRNNELLQRLVNQRYIQHQPIPYAGVGVVAGLGNLLGW